MTDEQLQAFGLAVEVDCEGEMCPGPVLKAMEALNGLESGEIAVLHTDLEVATQNVKVAVETGGLAQVLGVRHVDGLYSMYMERV